MLKGKRWGQNIAAACPSAAVFTTLQFYFINFTAKSLMLAMKNITEKNTRTFLHICVQFRMVFQVIGLIVLLNFIAFEKWALVVYFFPARFSIFGRDQIFSQINL